MGKYVPRNWILIAVIATLFLGGLLSYFVGRDSMQESEVVLWRDRQSLDDFTSTHRVLSGTLFEVVNWKDTPFEEALTQLENWIHESNADAQTIHFQIAGSVPRRTPITLKLREVPANEVLRYLSALNEARFDYRSNGLVEIVPLNTAPAPLEEGWFPIDSAFFHGIDPTQPEAVRKLFRSAGISVESSDRIEYFPDRGLLKVSSNAGNLDLIDASLWTGCSGLEPTWRDRFAEWWYQTKIRLRLTPAPPPIIPPSPSLAPDPFGGPAPTLPGSPPNPFGN